MKINTEKELRQLYDLPAERAQKKVLNKLDKHCINFINQSPFAILSTISNKGEMDASPRGGMPGFIKVLDDKTILIPDSKGNNRLDSLTNIIETANVGMLFMIPGLDETLRLNGIAEITNSPEILNQLNEEKTPIKTALVITVNEAFLHCAKALMRSKLWKEDHKVEPKDFPSIGKMIKDQIGSK